MIYVLLAEPDSGIRVQRNLPEHPGNADTSLPDERGEFVLLLNIFPGEKLIQLL